MFWTKKKKEISRKCKIQKETYSIAYLFRYDKFLFQKEILQRSYVKTNVLKQMKQTSYPFGPM